MPEPRRRPIWFYHVMALITVTIWSFAYVHITWLGQSVGFVDLLALRMDFFGLAVLLMLAWRRPNLRQLRARHWALMVLIGYVAGPGYHAPLCWAGTEGRIDAALMGLIIATIPVHAGWLGWVLLGERLTVVKIAALALGLAGVFTVIVGRHGSIDLLPEQLEGPLGVTLAAIMGGGIATLNRGARTVLPPVDLVIVTGSIGVIMTWFAHPWVDFQRIAALPWTGWWAAFFLGTIALGLCYVTWVTALSGLKAVNVAVYLFLAAVLSALWGWLFQDNVIGWTFLLGAGLVLTGLLIMVFGESVARAREAASPSTSPVADPN